MDVRVLHMDVVFFKRLVQSGRPCSLFSSSESLVFLVYTSDSLDTDSPSADGPSGAVHRRGSEKGRRGAEEAWRQATKRGFKKRSNQH